MKVAATLAALALATAASGAIEPPTTIGAAHLGSLTVTSGAFVSPKSVELMGVWNDPTVSCLANRKLRIRAAVDFIPAGGNPRRAGRTGVFTSPNCAEGGPMSASRSPPASSASPARTDPGSRPVTTS